MTLPGHLVGWVAHMRRARLVAIVLVISIFGLVGSICCGSAQAAGTVQSAPLDPAAGQYVPVTPTKILDTRSGIGVAAGAVQSEATVAVSPEGLGEVPSTGVSAVYVAVNAISPSASGCLEDYPDDQVASPGNCIAGFQTGQNEVNTDIVALGADGEAVIANDSPGAVEIAVTVLGYFTNGGSGEAAGETFVSVPDENLLDTRVGVGAPQAPIAPGASVTVQVAGAGGIPSDAVGVVGYVAGANASTSGFVSVYAAGTTDPDLSELTYQPGEADRDFIMSGLGSSGAVTLTNEGQVPADLVFDVTGYFVSPADGSEPGTTFVPLPITGLFDTGSMTPLAAGASATFVPTASGNGDIPSSGVSNVAESIAAVNPTASGYLTAYPAGESDPNLAVVNFVAGDARDDDMAQEDAVDLPSTRGETVTNHSSGTVEVVVYARGYWATPQTPSSPDIVEGSVDSTGTATVSWTPPSSDGGAAVTSYYVSVSDASGTVVASGTYAGTSTSATFTGLSPTETYTANVTASNAVGEGDAGTATVGDAAAGDQASSQSFATSQTAVEFNPSAETISVASASGTDGTLDSSGNVTSSESDSVSTSVIGPNELEADALNRSDGTSQPNTSGSGFTCVINTKNGATPRFEGQWNSTQTGKSYNYVWTNDLYAIPNARKNYNTGVNYYEMQYCTTGTGDTKNGWHQTFQGNAMVFEGTNKNRLIGWKWGSGRTTDGDASTTLGFELPVGEGASISASTTVSPGSGSLTGDFAADGNFPNYPSSLDSYNVNRINTYWHSGTTWIWDGTSDSEGNTGHALYEWPEPVGNLDFTNVPEMEGKCSEVFGCSAKF